MPEPPDPSVTIKAHPGKERSGSPVEREGIPFHMLLVGDFTPQESRYAWESGTKVVRVDKNAFAGVMKLLSPAIHIDIPNRIGGGQRSLELSLTFDSISAFHPDSVVQRVPVLAALMKTRVPIRQWAAGEIDEAALKEQIRAADLPREIMDKIDDVIASATRKETPRSGDTGANAKLDGILGMVDLGGEKQPPPKNDSPLGILFDAVSDKPSQGSPTDTSPLKTLATTLDGMIAAQLDDILHHPSFVHLEAAWRGLKFLVDRIDFRRNIRLSLIAAPKAELNAALYHQVLMAVHNETNDEFVDAPPACAIAAFDFDSSARDLEQLDDLADTMARLQVPIITGVAPSFFGVRTAADLASVPVVPQHMRRPEYASWNAFREKEISKLLTLVLPRILLRMPYGTGNAAKESGFVETPADGKDASFPWGTGALAVAAAIAESVAESGWPSLGARGQHVAGLPIRESVAGRKRMSIPLDVLLDDTKRSEYTDAGFTTLGCLPDHDSVIVPFAPVVHTPEEYEDPDATAEARIHSSLACQLLLARIAQRIVRLEGEVTAGTPADAIAENVRKRIMAFLGSGEYTVIPDAVETEVSDHPDSNAHHAVTIRIIPPEGILGREISIVMGMAVPKN